MIGGLWIALLVLIRVSAHASEHLPSAPPFFLQCSCLFPDADEVRIDFRTEGYDCQTRQYEELDYRPYFPIHADDKESELDRLGHFYYRDHAVLQSVADYLMESHNDRVGKGEATGDGIAGPIGGIRFLSLRIPLPALGVEIQPYTRVPIADVPADERHGWFQTDHDDAVSRCVREATP